MSDLDLTEAIEAADRSVTDYAERRYNLPPSNENIIRLVAPLIERQVRDRIAAEQTEYATRFDPSGPIRSACWQLIDIARGEQP
jgi:hypothetical protein